MKRIALIAVLPALLAACATPNSTAYSVTPDVQVTVKDTRKKARSPYVQQKSVTPPVTGAAGGSSR